MITQPKLEELIASATHQIENYQQTGHRLLDHSEIAELYFNRAEIYLAAKKYELALQDYNYAIDYDAYYYAAFEGRDLIETLMMNEQKLTAA